LVVEFDYKTKRKGSTNRVTLTTRVTTNMQRPFHSVLRQRKHELNENNIVERQKVPTNLEQRLRPT